jgi:hypothetical protein
MSRNKSLWAKLKLALLTGCVAASSPLMAQEIRAVPPGTPVTITVTPAQPAAPPVSITLGSRTGKVTPIRTGCTHTGGGIIDVAQLAPDTVVVTMTGAAVAYGGPHASVAAQTFCLDQAFEVSFDNPRVKKARLSLEARVIGLLRSHGKGGTAEVSEMCATVAEGPAALNVSLPPQSVAGGENLSLNIREGAVTVPAPAGKYCLRQTFAITASAPRCLLPCKAPSAEFADGAIDPLWISYKEPFRGAAKKDFGFQVTLRVVEDSDASGGAATGAAPRPNGDCKGDTAPKATVNPAPNAPIPVPVPAVTPAKP